MKKYPPSVAAFHKLPCTLLCQFVMLLLLSTFLPATVYAIGTSNGITGPSGEPFRAGMWWDSAEQGSGWDINKGGDVVFGIWYTYDADGNPVWYTTNGALSGGQYQGDLLSFTWDYDKKTSNEPTVAGQVSINFLNPQLAQINWQIGDEQDQATLRPFIFSATPTLTDHSGSWFDPTESGYGLTIQTQGDLTYGVLYYYDENGKPRWSAGTNMDGGEKLSMLTFKGSCPWCEYAAPTFSISGELAPVFDSEIQMKLDMSFPDDAAFWTKTQTTHIMISSPPSGRAHPAAMASIASKEALGHYIKAGYYHGNGGYGDRLCPPIVSPPRPSDSAGESAVLSATNVQEVGVDEADVVKATESYLYSLDFPLSDIPLNEEQSAFIQSISRYDISSDGAIPVGSGSFAVSLPSPAGFGGYVSGQGIYHYQPETASQKLIYIAKYVEGGCWHAFSASTYIKSFNAAVDTDFLARNELNIDGEMVSSRRIGNRLFVTTVYKPDIYAIAEKTLGQEAAQALYTDMDALFKAIDPELLLPRVIYADQSEHALVAVENIMMPPLPIHNIDPVFTTLSMFNLDDLTAPPVSIGIMGRVSGMYAAPESIYLTSLNTWPVMYEGIIVGYGYADTDIHKIAISESGLDYRGSGTVEGNLGYETDEIAFRMSEYQGYLRVLSDQDRHERWGDLGEHRLTVLAESDEDSLLLNTVSTLPNAERPGHIGKPGETVHAVRYQGERGYVVTFERVDPLYVLDLAEPQDPKILGELEIEGFSDYLHPVGDNLLIGIGMQAESSEMTGQLWLQGLQVGLFDVSVPTQPALLDLHEIGFRGTSSQVLNTHRAFTFLSGNIDEGEPMRFTIPVSEHGPVDGMLNPDPAYTYPWKSTGIVMFDVSQNPGEQAALELVGKADVASVYTVSEDHAAFYKYPQEDYSRSVIYGDQVFNYFRGGLFMTGWAGDSFTPAENCPLCEP